MAVQFKQATLDNGLTIVGEVNPESHTSAIGFFVKTGARDEAASVMGVSHFLEHMMFKGTETRSAADVDQQFDDIGADHNAFTTSELTAFYTHSLPEHIERGAEILSDIMRPSLRQCDFDDEKSVIIEEIAMYEDHPFWVLYERAMEEYYANHTLSHRVLGTRDTINALHRDQMMEYFTQRYSADNTVVSVAGRLDFDRLVDHIGQWCGSWQRTDAKRTYVEPVVPATEFSIASDKVNRHYMLMLAPAPSVQDDRRYAAGMLGQILGDVEGSRLYWALIETGLAEEAQAQYEGRDGLGEYFVYACCSPDDADDVKTVISKQIDAMVDSLTDDDLVRIRSKVATAVTMHGERPAGRMQRVGRTWCSTNSYRPLEEELARINAVTLDELRSVYEAYPIQPRVIGHLGPASFSSG